MNGNPSKTEIDYVRELLTRFNTECVGEDQHTPLNLVEYDESGNVIGGIIGGTYWGWLYIDILWVHEEHRKKGIGSRLLREAEQEAVRRGCHHVHLDTMSWQAPKFYKKHGYEVIAVLHDIPTGNQKYLLQKALGKRIMSKQDEFRRLAEDVANCHMCERLATLPHLKNSESLENDDHGLGTEHPYVNRWNLWHGNLDADIMVIGQDYGTKEDGNAFDVCDFANTTNPTDTRLKELFMGSFRIDLNANEAPLFFTNMANCYRKKRTSGGMHSGWLPICVNKFMARLIRIIRPKIIIVLGRVAFEALYCMEDLTINSLDPVENGKDSYAEIISHRYQIDLNDSKIDVFPVYHPGANSQMNRTLNQQLDDWKRIADHYKKIKQND